MDTFASTESSLGTIRKETPITRSPHLSGGLPTMWVQLNSPNWYVDMNSMEYQPCSDLGCVEMGTATFRVMVSKFNGSWALVDGLDADPSIRSGGYELGDYLRRQGRNPLRAAGLAKARQRLAQSVSAQAEASKPSSLSALRLQAGLSQSQLAQKMGTQQPAVARFEKDPSVMQYATMSAIARALGCKVGDVADIITNQIESSKHYAD